MGASARAPPGRPGGAVDGDRPGGLLPALPPEARGSVRRLDAGRRGGAREWPPRSRARALLGAARRVRAASIESGGTAPRAAVAPAPLRRAASARTEVDDAPVPRRSDAGLRRDHSRARGGRDGDVAAGRDRDPGARHAPHHARRHPPYRDRCRGRAPQPSFSRGGRCDARRLHASASRPPRHAPITWSLRAVDALRARARRRMRALRRRDPRPAPARNGGARGHPESSDGCALRRWRHAERIGAHR